VTKRRPGIEVGTENIFADLGLPDAANHLLKAQIVAEIYRICQARGLTQAAAGKRMGITQPEVSRMFHGVFREYSIERLMQFLTTFGHDIDIVVRPKAKPSRAGRVGLKLMAA